MSLIEGGAKDPVIREKFQEPEKNIDRMSSFRDPDSIYKIESGGLTIEPHPINIVELCSDIIDSLQSKAEKANIELKIKESSLL